MKKTCPKVCRILKATMIVFGFTASCVVGADCGWQPEGGCIPCPPLTNAVWPNWCPWTTNTPSVTPPAICQQIGTAPIATGVTKPQYAPGEKMTWVTTICEDTFPTEAIAYTVGAVKWDPVLPSTFTSVHKPAFSSTAYVIVTNSHPDPDLCSSDATFRYDIGTRVWNIVSPNANIYQHGWNYTPEWALWLANGALGYFSLGTVAPVTGNEVTNRIEFCCNDSGASVNSHLKTVATGQQTIGLSISVGTLTHLIGETAEKILNAIANMEPNSSLANWLEANVPNITVAGISASGSENFQEVIGYSETCECEGRPVSGAFYGSKVGGFTANGIGVTIPPSVSGLTSDLNLTLLIANLTFRRTGSDGQYIPNATNVEHTEHFQTIRDIHTHYSFIWNNEPQTDDYFYTVDANGAPGIDLVSTSVVTYLCEGQSYPVYNH